MLNVWKWFKAEKKEGTDLRLVPSWNNLAEDNTCYFNEKKGVEISNLDFEQYQKEKKRTEKFIIGLLKSIAG